MTMLAGPENATSQGSGAFLDTHSAAPRRPRPTGGGSELSGHILGEVGGVRTEVQVRPFEGFATGKVVPRDEMRWGTNGSPTKLLAKPPAWVPDETPCAVPPEEKWDRGMRESWWDIGPGDKPGSDGLAASMCAACPVRDACLADALADERDMNGRPLDYKARFLVRGGMTPRGRWQVTAVENTVDVARCD